MKNLLGKINTKLDAQGGFLKSVSVLAGGTAFAQALGVLVLPLITRLYSPEEFALFAVYTSIVGILTVAICLRFEIAIPLPEKDEDALSLFMLSLLSNILLTTLLTVVIFFFQESLFTLIQQPQLKHYQWLIPIGVFLAGLYSSLQYWATRKKQFNTIAQTRMTQAVSSSVVQIGAGYLSFGVIGLLFGQIINFSAGIVRLFISFSKETKHLINQISITKLKENWKKYDKFPKYSTLEALAHSSSMQLPIVIIGTFLLGSEAGYILIAMKVMTIPMSLIGGSIAQVYLANAPDYYLHKNLYDYSLSVVKNILKISFLPILIIGIGSYFLFPYIFGKEWAPAGKIAIYLIPWILMQIISSPITLALHILGKQKIAMMLQFFGFAIRVIFLIIMGIIAPSYLIEYFALSGFIFYFIYLFFIFRVIYKEEREQK